MKLQNIGLGLLSLALVVGPAFSSPAIAQEDDSASVTVFHAVSAEDGFPADVYLDGQLVIDGFVFQSSSDTFTLPAGTPTLEIYPHGADPAAEDAIVTTSVTFEAGQNYSLVAQIADGSPVITLFVNDTTTVGPGEARFTYRQASAIDSLSVQLDGTDTFTELTPTNEATTALDAGTKRLTIRDNGVAAVFDEDVEFADGMLTVLYGVGDPLTGTFDVLIQEIPLTQVSPLAVPTGSGGDKASQGMPYITAALIVMVLAIKGGNRVSA